MTQHYVSTKIVQGWHQDRQDIPGYAVKYEDGYTSWSPAPQFEAASVALGQIGHLPPHEQRVIAEFAQLADRLHKLNAFMLTPLYASLPEDDQRLLRMQADAMALLAKILNMRVDKFVDRFGSAAQ
jgi:hypothetical protein